MLRYPDFRELRLDQGLGLIQHERNPRQTLRQVQRIPRARELGLCPTALFYLLGCAPLGSNLRLSPSHSPSHGNPNLLLSTSRWRWGSPKAWAERWYQPPLQALCSVGPALNGEGGVPAKTLSTSPAQTTISHHRLQKAEGTSALLPQQISLSPAGI